MIQTVNFRIYPDKKREYALNEIFTIYNRVKRIGYNLLFHGEDHMKERFSEVKTIQQRLMSICHNNPYVNTILIDNKAMLEAQKTFLEKRQKRMTQQIQFITDKINKIKAKYKLDRRLKGLYARRSSIIAKLHNLQLKAVVFGTKKLFRQRILGKISRKEFRIQRDSSFRCIGKKQYARMKSNRQIETSHVSVFNKID